MTREVAPRDVIAQAMSQSQISRTTPYPHRLHSARAAEHGQVQKMDLDSCGRRSAGVTVAILAGRR